MIEFAPDAPGKAACGRDGLSLMAECPCGRPRSVPFRLFKTIADGIAPLYGRQFKCLVCGSREVELFAIENQAELDRVRPSLSYKLRQSRGISTPGDECWDPDSELLQRQPSPGAIRPARCASSSPRPAESSTSSASRAGGRLVPE